MKQAGAGAPSANRITLLRDADGDGVAEMRASFLAGPELAVRHGAGRRRLLRRQHRRAWSRFPYTRGRRRGSTRAGTQARRPARRPAEPPLDQEPDRQPRRQQALRHGRLEQQRRRERHGRRGRPARRSGRSTAPPAPGALFASGLRNPDRHGLASRGSGALWTVVNERDELGSDLVPDYLTSVRRRRLLRLALQLFRPARRRAGASRRGPTWSPRRSCPTTRSARTPPRSAWPSTTARCCRRFASGAFIGQHGSWNRKPPSGYKVIFVPFAGGRPAGAADRRADRLPRRRRQGARPPGRRRDRQGAAPCWSPTTSATSSGGWPRRSGFKLDTGNGHDGAERRSGLGASEGAMLDAS